MTKKTKKDRQRFNALVVRLDEQHADPNTGQIKINITLGAENKVHLVHNNQIIPSLKQVQGYFGQNKTRTLSVIPKDPADHSMSLLKKLQRYDKIIGVDTNTKNIVGQTFSIGIACHLIGQINNDNSTLEWIFVPINQLFVLHGKGDKIENRNWKQLIEFIIRHENYRQEERIGVIVDSDLENIDGFNSRQKPIIADFYLPSNFELIYASDRAMDEILNKIIGHCHTMSSDALKKLEDNLKVKTRT